MLYFLYSIHKNIVDWTYLLISQGLFKSATWTLDIQPIVLEFSKSLSVVNATTFVGEIEHLMVFAKLKWIFIHQYTLFWIYFFSNNHIPIENIFLGGAEIFTIFTQSEYMVHLEAFMNIELVVFFFSIWENKFVINSKKWQLV